MRDVILLAIIVGLIILTLKKPFYGVLTWCWISYMLPHKLSWGFMLHFPSAQLVAIAFITSLIFSKEKKTINWHSPIVWLLIFNLSMLLSTLIGSKDFGALQIYTQTLKVQFFTFLIYMMLTNRERIDQALWVICASIGYYGVKGGIFVILNGGKDRVWGPPGGYFEGNNELGLTLLMIVPVMYYLMHTVDKKWCKHVIAISIFLCIAAVLGTHSRGALVALIALAGFFVLKSDKKFIAIVLLIFLLPIGYQFMPDSWHQRMSSIVQNDEASYDGSIQGRFNAWRMAFNLAAEHPAGDGFGAFNRVNFVLYAPNPEDFHDAHSIYFKVLAQQGWLGLGIYIAMWLSAWRLANKVQKVAKKHQDLQWADLLCRMLQLSLIAYASGGMFLGLSYFDLPYHMLITICAVYFVVMQQLEQKSQETEVSNNPALQRVG